LLRKQYILFCSMGGSLFHDSRTPEKMTPNVLNDDSGFNDPD